MCTLNPPLAHIVDNFDDLALRADRETRVQHLSHSRMNSFVEKEDTLKIKLFSPTTES